MPHEPRRPPTAQGTGGASEGGTEGASEDGTEAGPDENDSGGTHLASGLGSGPWSWTLGLAALALVSLAARWQRGLLAPAAILALALAALTAWRAHQGDPLDPRGEDEASQAAAPSRATAGGDDPWALPGPEGQAWHRVAIFVLVAASLVATWIGQRPPWTPWAGGLLWTGALALTCTPRPRTGMDDTALVAGALAAGLVGWLAGQSWPGVTSIALAALVVPVGRLAIVRVAHHEGAWQAGVFALAATLPFAWGVWGLSAVAAEALLAVLFLDQAADDTQTHDAWALSGVVAGIGAAIALFA